MESLKECSDDSKLPRARAGEQPNHTTFFFPSVIAAASWPHTRSEEVGENVNVPTIETHNSQTAQTKDFRVRGYEAITPQRVQRRF